MSYEFKLQFFKYLIYNRHVSITKKVIIVHWTLFILMNKIKIIQ